MHCKGCEIMSTSRKEKKIKQGQLNIYYKRSMTRDHPYPRKSCQKTSSKQQKNSGTLTAGSKEREVPNAKSSRMLTIS